MALPSIGELPPEIGGPSAWYGPDLAARRDWIVDLSEADIAEIERATQGLINSRTDIPSISPQDFPLPSFGPRLRSMLAEVLSGRGFVLIRGLPIERWSKLESA